MVLGDESNEQWRISVRQTNEQITCDWSCHARASTMATCFEWSLKIAEFIIILVFEFNAARGITKHLLWRSHLTADFLDVLWHWKAENVCEFIYDIYTHIYLLYFISCGTSQLNLMQETWVNTCHMFSCGWWVWSFTEVYIRRHWDSKIITKEKTINCQNTLL